MGGWPIPSRPGTGPLRTDDEGVAVDPSAGVCEEWIA